MLEEILDPVVWSCPKSSDGNHVFVSEGDNVTSCCHCGARS